MSYEYQPKYPRAKLREIVTKYMTAMRTMGRRPNCSVAFATEEGAEAAARVDAWLLRDPDPHAAGRRYILLGDGDVWREVPAAPAGEAAAGDRIWLNGPDDDIVTLLARSQANARLGGGGFLEDAEQVHLGAHTVADRRRERHPHGGPERRSRD